MLLVVDAMTGQEAVNVAEGFNLRVPLTGLIMTKIDGDARGGAALSVRHVTGVPIKFLGTGEKLADLEPFQPDRLAGRILGMGDVLSLIERAQDAIDEDDALAIEKRLQEGNFDFEDFLDQLNQIKKLGPITDILGMIPGCKSYGERARHTGRRRQPEKDRSHHQQHDPQRAAQPESLGRQPAPAYRSRKRHYGTRCQHAGQAVP